MSTKRPKPSRIRALILLVVTMSILSCNISTSTQTPTPTVALERFSPPRYGQVAASEAIARESPDVSSPETARLPAGATVSVVAHQGDWVQIESPDVPIRHRLGAGPSPRHPGISTCAYRHGNAIANIVATSNANTHVNVVATTYTNGHTSANGIAHAATTGNANANGETADGRAPAAIAGATATGAAAAHVRGIGRV